MARMSIAVRDDLQAWAEAQVREGRFASPDDLVNALLADEREQERRRAWLREAIAAGEASGDPLPGRQVLAELRAKHGLPDAGL